MLRFLVALLCLFAFPAHAEKLDMRHFAQIPIAHDGRIKPLGRFAAGVFSDITGRTIGTYDAARLLATALFDPSNAVTLPLFYVPDPALQKKLALPPTPDSRYAFSAVNNGFVRLGNNLDRNDDAIMRLYTATVAFEQIKDAVIMVLPLNGMAGHTLLDLPKTHELTQSLSARGENNTLLRVVDTGGDWVTPWAFFLGPDKNKDALRPWEKMARAYLSADDAGWGDATYAVYDATSPRMKTAFAAEIFYSALNPYAISMGFYALAFCIALLPFAMPIWVSLLPLVAGVAVHGAGLVLRMVILARPPVSTLYESVLFVGFITVMAMAIMAWRMRGTWIIAGGAALGVALHVMGFFLADDADNLRVLAAVLDTKFWLAVHVLVITAGYGACLVTAAVAYAALVLMAMRRPAAQTLYNQAVYCGVLSLFLVALGTILGGIWADQSWGRFWGWDPKENGALLIILWLTWLLHGRVTGQVSKIFMACGLAALVSIVGISWVGVNTLGVGLHSYGFMGGLAFGLGAVIVGQTLSLFVLWRGIRQNGYDT